MRTKLLLILALIIYGNGNAQDLFQDHIVTDESNTIDRPATILSADLDGDGNKDIISTSYARQRIVWFKNDGNGKFGDKHFIANSLTNEQVAFAKDIDGDGDIDILCAISGGYSDRVFWYENDGQGEFELSHHITSSMDVVRAISAVDMDADGDSDVVVASNYDDKLTWFENTDGEGDFGSQHIIDDTGGTSSVYASDIDNDGDMDLVTSFYKYATYKINWYENTNGQGDFSEAQTIANNVGGPSEVFSADMDGDGDMDVVATTAEADKIVWYENTNGQGSFSSQNTISTETNGARSLYAADLDDDGDTDLVLTSDDDHKLVWYENTDGQGNFGGQQLITTNANGANINYIKASVNATDMDNDGDMDVVASSSTNDKIAWYENTEGEGNFGAEHILTGPSYPVSSYAADMDGDDDIEIVTASVNDGKIAWFENMDGEGSFSSQHIITADANRPRSVYLTDLDGDGDIDILFASVGDNKIAWYENTDGLGNFSDEKVISTNIGSGSVTVYFSDIDGDGDGDEDIISASDIDQKIRWFENTDGQGNFSTEKIISDNVDDGDDIYTDDLDGDGDMDVLLTIFNDPYDDNENDKVVWFENLDGQGNFGPSQTIGYYWSNKVRTADIDGDGDQDVVATATYFNGIFVHKNDGQGNFDTNYYNIPFEVTGAKILAICDLDGDGDMDILGNGQIDYLRTSTFHNYSSYTDPIEITKIVWYENTDGQGDFSVKHLISDDSSGLSSLFAADINGDNNIDIISTSVGDDKISWYENPGNLSMEKYNAGKIKLYPNPTEGKLIIKAKRPIRNLKLYNQLGQKVFSRSFQNGFPQSEIDISNLESGIYFLKIEIENGKKLVKQVVKN